LLFADDIVLISSDIQEVKNMLKQLNKATNDVGLKMNLSKTKIKSRIEENIKIADKTLDILIMSLKWEKKTKQRR